MAEQGYGALAAFAALLALSVWWQRRARDPILPPRLFAVPALRVVLPATALLGALLGGSLVYLPTFVQAAYGMGATQAGLALTPYVLTFTAVSFAAGAVPGARVRPFLPAGGLIVVLGFVSLSRVGPGTPYPQFAVVLGVLGVGFGLLMQNLVVVAQNAAAPADLAATTSAAMTARGLGLSLGVSAFGALLTRTLEAHPGGARATAAAVPEALAWGVPAAVVLVVLLAFLPR
ncbi:hypothetical protein ACIBEJ_14915 [Nonomuraea sp. NPDC050790]|uniref:hypothetical protein n=1 Tax=Nonomuraea sp. NPDC050790 TaxID=3364371 RepID=UPI00378D6A12